MVGVGGKSLLSVTALKGYRDMGRNERGIDAGVQSRNRPARLGTLRLMAAGNLKKNLRRENNLRYLFLVLFVCPVCQEIRIYLFCPRDRIFRIFEQDRDRALVPPKKKKAIPQSAGCSDKRSATIHDYALDQLGSRRRMFPASARSSAQFLRSCRGERSSCNSF